MNIKIKICGMKFQDNILNVASLQPDYLGFIFYEKSPRYFDGELPELPKNIKKTGVFVNASMGFITEKTNRYELQALQLHGNETPEFCKELRTKFPKKEILKVFSVGEDFDFFPLESYLNVVDAFLFDTKGKHHGGNGKVFNWKLLADYPYQKPIIISGGIGLESLPQIKKLIKTDLPILAFDINSKFEADYGLKDIPLLQKFMKNINDNTPIGGQPYQSKYQVNEKGYYGKFGGAFIPEMLYPNVEKLRKSYLKIISTQEFKEEFNQLLKDYVGRPSPLYYAQRLSEQYNTKIYLKREDLNHTGAHKINNTIGQILVARKLGKKRIIAETGAGQHGVATATVCALAGLKCIVYMGEIDIKRQAPNVARMKMLGAEVRPAKSGSKTLKDATNEAIRDWINNPNDTHYIIGSVVGPHPYPDMVARFQSVISEEVKKQLLEYENQENPDYLIACVGGGSNAAGLFYHYLDEKNVKIIAVEAAGHGVHSGESAATSVLGKDGIIHGSRTLLMQTDDGQITEPYSISAGLDYPGIGPMHAHLQNIKRAEFLSVTDDEAMKAGLNLCKKEGIIPAIESSHALATLDMKKFKPKDIIVINLSGRGDKDLNTYINFFGY